MNNRQWTEQFAAYLESFADEAPQDKAARERRWAETEEHYAKMPFCDLPAFKDRAAAEAFFTPDMMGRVIYTPNYNEDIAGGGWGMADTEPAFLFVKQMHYKGFRCLNDQVFVDTPPMRQVPGRPFLTISFDDFPGRKFGYSLITAHNNKEAFAFLNSRLHMPTLEPSRGEMRQEDLPKPTRDPG